MDKNKERVAGLAAWLEKLGVSKKWAIAIAILIIACGVAVTTLITPSCGVMDFAIRGDDGGSLSFSRDSDTGALIINGVRDAKSQKGK